MCIKSNFRLHEEMIAQLPLDFTSHLSLLSVHAVSVVKCVVEGEISGRFAYLNEVNYVRKLNCSCYLKYFKNQN